MKIGKVIQSILPDFLKFLQVDEMDHDLGLLNVMNPDGRPFQVIHAPGRPLRSVPSWGRIDMSAAANNVTAMTGSPLAVKVPIPGDLYLLINVGGTAYVCTDGGTAAAGCSGIPCPSEIPMGPVQLFRNLSVIASGGFFYLLHLIED